ncbi:MAG: hemolysin family protein [Flavobacteriaceae bacterium]
MSSDGASGNGRGEGGFFRRLAQLFGDRNHSVRESISDALDTKGQAGDPLSAKERSMLRNILNLRDSRVEDVMVPRADIVAVDAEADLAAAILVFRDAGHSRLPVYRETLDDPLGMVHIKDVLGFVTAQATGARAARGTQKPPRLDLRKTDLSVSVSKAKILRQVLYVPPSMPVVDLLLKMQTTRVHLALVVDEYGGTDGLVSIEDLVEEIVGDIEDEHDEQSGPPIVAAGDGTFVADARATVEDLNAALGVEVVPEDIAEDVDTIGGLVFHKAGHVPVRGELVEIADGIEFEIIDADPRRIKRVKIRKSAPGESRKARRSRRKAEQEAPKKD